MDTKDSNLFETYEQIFENADVTVEPDLHNLTPNRLKKLAGDWPEGVNAFTEKENEAGNVFNGKSNLDPQYLGDGVNLAVSHQKYSEAARGYNPQDPLVAIHQYGELSENDEELMENLEEKGNVEILGKIFP